jgi:hypothetical protein
VCSLWKIKVWATACIKTILFLYLCKLWRQYEDYNICWVLAPPLGRLLGTVLCFGFCYGSWLAVWRVLRDWEPALYVNACRSLRTNLADCAWEAVVLAR